MPPASYLAQARIADQYRQALRDSAMHPGIHYDLARARIADLHGWPTAARWPVLPVKPAVSAQGDHDDSRRIPRGKQAVTGTAAAPPATAASMGGTASRFLYPWSATPAAPDPAAAPSSHQEEPMPANTQSRTNRPAAPAYYLGRPVHWWLAALSPVRSPRHDGPSARPAAALEAR